MGEELVTLSIWDDGESLEASLRLEVRSDGPASSSEEKLEDDTASEGKVDRATAGDECALLAGVRLRLPYVTALCLRRRDEERSMVGAVRWIFVYRMCDMDMARADS